jgi:hypothetical protein
MTLEYCGENGIMTNTKAAGHPPCGTFPRLRHTKSKHTLAEAKARQSIRIRQLAAALKRAGIASLDAQAQALGLRRSTAWTILQGRHKTSGLSAKVVLRILASPSLPPAARDALIAYIDEKNAGAFGHGKRERRKFATRLKGEVNHDG